MDPVTIEHDIQSTFPQLDCQLLPTKFDNNRLTLYVQINKSYAKDEKQKIILSHLFRGIIEKFPSIQDLVIKGGAAWYDEGVLYTTSECISKYIRSIKLIGFIMNYQKTGWFIPYFLLQQDELETFDICSLSIREPEITIVTQRKQSFVEPPVFLSKVRKLIVNSVEWMNFMPARVNKEPFFSLCEELFCISSNPKDPSFLIHFILTPVPAYYFTKKLKFVTVCSAPSWPDVKKITDKLSIPGCKYSDVTFSLLDSFTNPHGMSFMFTPKEDKSTTAAQSCNTSATADTTTVKQEKIEEDTTTKKQKRSADE